MKALRKFLDKQAVRFEPGGPLEKFHALYEAPDTILFTPGLVTKAGALLTEGRHHDARLTRQLALNILKTGAPALE